MTVALYLRISQDRQQLQAGVDRQLADCRKLAASKYPNQVTLTFQDNDLSAYTKARRPGFDSMLANIQRREIHAVIAYNIDRLVRRPAQLEELIDLGIPIITAAGDLDLTTHDGQLHARILVAVAKKSSDDTSRRVKREARDRAEQGRFHGGPYPYGYTTGMQPDPIAAAHVQQVAERVARGGTIPITSMGPQTLTGWRMLLESPQITGLTRLHTRANWPAIISRDLWLEVQGVLQQRNLEPRGIRRLYWVTAVLVCGVCGQTLRRDKRFYRCRDSCTLITDQGDIEPYIEGLLFAGVKVTQRTNPTIDIAPDPKLSELAVDYADGTITRAEWLAARDRLLAAARTPVALEPGVPADLERSWEKFSTAERATLARRVLTVRLMPAQSRGVRGELEDRLQPVYAI